MTRQLVADFILGALRIGSEAKDLQQEVLFEDRISLIARTGHPLTQRARINFAALLKPLYARVFLDTAWSCFLTAACTLFVGYPIAYALVHAQSTAIKAAPSMEIH